MEKYKSYKPSGIDWIGEIPHNWEVGKLKHNSELNISSVDKHIFDDEISVRVCNYTDVYYNENISNELDFKIGSCTETEYDKFLLKKGDVIITKDSESPNDIGVPSYVTDELENVVCGYHLSIIKSKSESLLGGYLFRQLQTKRVRRYFEINSNGITRFGLGKSSVLELPLLLPSISEQNQIVQYLDEKTDLIDKLISTKERKITLLKEQRTSLINQVVTKGLNPNVKMKDSGVEWIGEIPIHWNLIKMKHKGDVIIGLSYSPEDIVDEGEGILVMRSSNVQEGKPSFLDNVYVSSKIPNKLLLKKGDILICSRNGSRRLIGKNCMITENEEGMTFGVFMTIYRSNYSRFMYWLLNSPIFESQSGLFLTSTINQLTVSTLQNMILPFVEDKEEQNQIVSFLDSKTKEIDDMISLEQTKIDLLKEYRQSLISEVVSGKIKVTTD